MHTPIGLLVVSERCGDIVPVVVTYSPLYSQSFGLSTDTRPFLPDPRSFHMGVLRPALRFHSISK